MTNIDMDEFVKVQDYCWEYLSESFDRRWELGSELVDFRETHGEKEISSMVRFVEWAKKNGKEDIIQDTLTQAIAVANNSSASPKTSGY